MRKNMAFVAYAESYRKKHFIHQLIEKKQAELAELEKKLLAVKENQSNAEQKVKNSQKNIHLAELTLKELDEQEASKKKRILSTKNAKEYESFMKELDLIAQKKPEQEDAIFILWEQFEQDKKNLERITHESADMILELQDKIAVKHQEIKQNENLLNEIAVISEEKGRLVGQELRDKLLKMLEAVANPAVPVEQGSCTGCFSAVPRVAINKIEQGEILVCGGCSRLLYFVRPES